MEKRFPPDLIPDIRSHAELFDVPDQAVIATTLDGTIVYWSDYAIELYGWSRAEVIGQNIVTITPAPPSREQANAIMQQLRAGSTWSGSFQVRRRDGTTFQTRVRDVPVRNHNGEFIGIVGISGPNA